MSNKSCRFYRHCNILSLDFHILNREGDISSQQEFLSPVEQYGAWFTQFLLVNMQEEARTSNGALTVARVEPDLRSGAMRMRAATGAAMIRLEGPSSSNGVLVAAAVLLGI